MLSEQEDFSHNKIILIKDELLQEVIQQDVILFPVSHEKFIQDGQLQAAMEAKDLTFIESDSKASALCMNKFPTK
jgi:D-alanine-D-alanine ligase-like ATP-grasp enzyme